MLWPLNYQTLKPMNVQEMLDQLTPIIINYGAKLLGAILVWIVGSWIIKGLIRAFTGILEKRDVDASLKPFLKNITSTLLKILLIISVLSMLGIEMTSFIAIIAAAGLAVGLALSGTLQNFAGGVVILLFRPFKVGDYITAQGYSGTVNEIQIFSTILRTPDNKTVIIPNGELSTSALTNYSTEATRRVDWTIGIGYGDAAAKAESVIRRLLAEDERIFKEPEVFVAISELADSSVNFAVRAWVNAEDYWGVFFRMNRKVYEVFDQEGLNIPFPQMDIHVHND